MNQPNEFVPASQSQLVVQNESDEIICYVEVRAVNSRGPGVDQLPVDDIVAPGERRIVHVEGHQHLELLDCNRHVIFARDVNFTQDGRLLRFYERE